MPYHSQPVMEFDEFVKIPVRSLQWPPQSTADLSSSKRAAPKAPIAPPPPPPPSPPHPTLPHRHSPPWPSPKTAPRRTVPPAHPHRAQRPLPPLPLLPRSRRCRKKLIGRPKKSGIRRMPRCPGGVGVSGVDVVPFGMERTGVYVGRRKGGRGVIAARAMIAASAGTILEV